MNMSDPSPIAMVDIMFNLERLCDLLQAYVIGSSVDRMTTEQRQTMMLTERFLASVVEKTEQWTKERSK